MAWNVSAARQTQAETVIRHNAVGLTRSGHSVIVAMDVTGAWHLAEPHSLGETDCLSKPELFRLTLYRTQIGHLQEIVYLG